MSVAAITCNFRTVFFAVFISAVCKAVVTSFVRFLQYSVAAFRYSGTVGIAVSVVSVYFCSFVTLFVLFQIFNYFAAVFRYCIAAKRQCSAVFALDSLVSAFRVSFAVRVAVAVCSVEVFAVVADFFVVGINGFITAE